MPVGKRCVCVCVCVYVRVHMRESERERERYETTCMHYDVKLEVSTYQLYCIVYTIIVCIQDKQILGEVRTLKKHYMHYGIKLAGGSYLAIALCSG